MLPNLAGLTPKQIATLLRPLPTHKQAAGLARFEWLDRARPKQVPPPGDWAVFLACAGRGFGKSLLAAQEAWWYAAWNDGVRVAVVAPTSGDLRRVCFEGDSGILSVVPSQCLKDGDPGSAYNRSLSELTFANGSIIQGFSAAEPNRLRGPQFHFAICLGGDTLVTMGDGSCKPIATVRRGDMVMTRVGPRRVLVSCMTHLNAEVLRLRTSCGLSVLATTSHLFYNPHRGFMPLGDFREGDALCRIGGLNGAGASGGAALTATITTMTGTGSTEQFTRTATAPSRPATMFTTRTRTGETTTPTISRQNRTASTSRITAGESGLSAWRRGLLRWRSIGAIFRSAMRRVLNAPPFSEPGLLRAASVFSAPLHVGSVPKAMSSFLSAAHACVASPLISQHGGRSGFAQIGATGSTMKWSGLAPLIDPLPAPTAGMGSARNGATPNSAGDLVPWLTTSRVTSVERHPTRIPVYDLTVEGAPEFFANGLLVHNCDEAAAWDRGVETWDMLSMTMRLGDKPQVIVATTPRPVPLIHSLMARAGHDVVVVRGSTYENRENLAPGFIQQLTERYAGTRIGQQEVEAELLEDFPGAIWTRGMIEAARLMRLPDGLPHYNEPGYHRALAGALGMIRIVVGVDPSGARDADDKDADEIGIVAAGIDRAGIGYILEDASGIYSPEGWGSMTAQVFDRWRADKIIAEANFGGGMVESTIRAVRRTLPVKLVSASRGKVVRAEPVAALFEQGRVRHVGMFPKLEDQLCAFTRTGYQGTGSPDRADAMIWCVTELMLSEGFSAIERFKAMA